MSDLFSFDNFIRGKRPYFWILFSIVLVYGKSLFFDFSYFDDNVLVLDNLSSLRDISNFFRSFTTEVFHILHSSAAYYRPILTVSYMFDALISGSNPFVYHLTSVLIHSLVSVSLFGLLLKLGFKKEFSFFSSLVFSVHPVLAQAVVWIPGRNDSLLALFVILTFFFLLNFLESKNIKYFWISSLFFFLALFTKESSLVFPVLIIFYFLLLGNKDEKRLFFKISPLLFFVWGAVFLMWFYLRSIALSQNPVHYSLYNSLVQIYRSLPALFLYLGKFIFPFNLSVLPTLVDSSLVYGYVSFTLIVFLIFVSKNKDWRWIIFGVIWFLAFLLPSFIRPSEFMPYFLEHRIYLPIVGLIFVFSQISIVYNLSFSNLSNLIFFFAALFFLSLVNFFHIGKFKNRISFWESAVRSSPSHPLAHRNLGAMYYLEGNLDKAYTEFQKTLEINFEEPMVHNNLGLIYMQRSEYNKAEEEFNLELKFNPLYDNSLFNLGLLYWQKGEKEKAAESWIKTISVNPDHKDALLGLYSYYKEKGDLVKSDYYRYQLALRGISF